MILVCWALMASFIAGYYWFLHTDTIKRIGGIQIYVNVGINYGSGIGSEWHNATKALSGMTLLGVTKDVADITFDTSPGYGAYILSINDVAANKTHGWVWWRWDNGMHNWVLVSISSDAYAVANDETLLWFYESGWPPSPPV